MVSKKLCGASISGSGINCIDVCADYARMVIVLDK